ncbi:hypothetical protein DVQ78_21600, partial [Yersinia enterocolitica]|nr:hypothetical protein [Yersinia enterocolitica]
TANPAHSTLTVVTTQANSTITADDGTSADVATKATLTLTLKTASDTLVPGQTVNFTVEPTDAGTILSAVTDNKDGTYTATVTSTKAQAYTITPTVGGGIFGDTTTGMVGSLTVVAAAPDAATSVYTPIKTVATRTTHTVVGTLNLKDKYANPVMGATDAAVAVNVTNVDATAYTTGITEVTASPGNYDVGLDAQKWWAPRALSINVSGNAISSPNLGQLAVVPMSDDLTLGTFAQAQHPVTAHGSGTADYTLLYGSRYTIYAKNALLQSTAENTWLSSVATSSTTGGVTITKAPGSNGMLTTGISSVSSGQHGVEFSVTLPSVTKKWTASVAGTSTTSLSYASFRHDYVGIEAGQGCDAWADGGTKWVGPTHAFYPGATSSTEPSYAAAKLKDILSEASDTSVSLSGRTLTKTEYLVDVYSYSGGNSYGISIMDAMSAGRHAYNFTAPLGAEVGSAICVNVHK